MIQDAHPRLTFSVILLAGVVAGLARWIGSDPEVQEKLYHADSPAHAHDVLHADEAEGFNYYLATV